ncbi:MAG: ADP-ribose-binding protein [Gammaproteobacteria bacterium]|nr:ADP-ribose-binding protein [Gammaproteobacteria bacterium]
MIEITGNLWEYIGEADCICITTNGFVKKNGEAVMGKGCAKQALTRYPDIGLRLGTMLKNEGNKPVELYQDSGTRIWSFPVKPRTVPYLLEGQNVVEHMRNKFKKDDMVPGWAAKACINLILQSAAILQKYADSNKWESVIIPRPGCGAGELNWDYVSSKLHPLLDDRFKTITYR